MKPQILTLGALVLVSLLTWLGMKGASTGASVSDSALRVLDEYSAAESALYRDVLSARVGTLRNYDAITQGAERLDRVVADLRTIALSDPQLLPEVEKLANRVDQQVRWSERFTTSNALLQNSLAYFDIAGRRLTDEGPGPLAQEVGALAAAVLHLTMDSSPAAVADVDVRLTSMNPHEYKDFTVVESLRSHAKLLQTVLPQTEGTVKSLFVVAAGSEPSELRSMVLARRRDAERRTTVFRYGLLAASLVLAGALLLLGNSLRRHSEALRRRAAIEHILARISMRFISSKPGDLTEHIQRALAELATCCGASRAYFLTPEAASEEPYRWITPGAAFPHNWFSRVTAVARRMRSGTNDVIHVIDTERLPHGLNRECLISGGARAWLCATSTVKGQEAILGEHSSIPVFPAAT